MNHSEEKMLDIEDRLENAMINPLEAKQERFALKFSVERMKHSIALKRKNLFDMLDEEERREVERLTKEKRYNQMAKDYDENITGLLVRIGDDCALL